MNTIVINPDNKDAFEVGGSIERALNMHETLSFKKPERLFISETLFKRLTGFSWSRLITAPLNMFGIPTTVFECDEDIYYIGGSGVRVKPRNEEKEDNII